MRKTLILVAVMLLGSAVMAHAAIGPELYVGQLFKLDGTTPLPEGSVLALYADTEGNGFGDMNFGLSQIWSSQADDLLVDVWDTNNQLENFTIGGLVSGSYYGQRLNLNVNGSASGEDPNLGKPMRLFWFDAPLADLSLAANDPLRVKKVGDVVNYYSFSDPDGGVDYSEPWLVPKNGLTPVLTFVTESAGGSRANSLGIASLSTQVVPEPVSYVLALIGAGAMAVRRRFNKVKA